MEALHELKDFLAHPDRLDLKAVALTHFLSLTGNLEGRTLICQHDEVLQALLNLLPDSSEVIQKDALLTLVNLTADPAGAEKILTVTTNEQGNALFDQIIASIMDENCPTADLCTMILSNLSRPEHLIEKIMDLLEKYETVVEKLVACYTRIQFNKRKQHLNYLGPIFSNISQSSRGRRLFCDTRTALLLRIMPFINHESALRRGGAVGLLKNICFESTIHEWLFDQKIDILAYILLPLAGPEEFDDEDNEMLPTELQYLGPDKQREADPDIRIMLLECLSQLSAMRRGREHLRKNGTYLILRELHKFEHSKAGDARAATVCENVVDVLIRTEDEIGADNLKHMEIPDHLAEKFNEFNEIISS